jgi:ArsR family transcriptional regulator
MCGPTAKGVCQRIQSRDHEDGGPTIQIPAAEFPPHPSLSYGMRITSPGSGSLPWSRIISKCPNMVEEATRLFRVVADPTRRRILHLLRAGELCVGDLVTVLGVPQPTASRHLGELKRAGLIVARKNSYWTFYALAPARTTLRRKLFECLDADVAGRSRDLKRLAAVRRRGGCCPM